MLALNRFLFWNVGKVFRELQSGNCFKKLAKAIALIGK